jgi:hypothetical protein
VLLAAVALADVLCESVDGGVAGVGGAIGPS